MPGRAVREKIVATVGRVVVKVGTNSICGKTGRPDRRAIARLASQIAHIREMGKSVSLVASGAIGAGVGELSLPARPKTLPDLQAVAAVGQGQLMRTFHDVFAEHDIPVAQVLVTRADFEDRTRYLNIRNTLSSLEAYGALPIINENDTVAVDEIRFGENDVLAALVANLQGADLLVMLTTVDGVMRSGEVLDVIEQVDAETMGLARDERSSMGSGGMASKLQAARLVVQAGEVAVIASARATRVLERILDGKRVGTVFVPATRRMSSRERWIGQVSRPTGRVTIDAGAVRAIREKGKSLLPSGVTRVSGSFPVGATVIVEDPAGQEVARGLVNYDAMQIEKIRGLKTSEIARVLGDKPYDEVIHRDNMTVA